MAVIDHRSKTLPMEGTKYVIRNLRMRAYPNQAQQEHLSRVFGCTRYVFNKTLEQAQLAYEAHKASPDTTPKPALSPYDLSKCLTALKQSPSHAWLYEVSKSPLQEAVHNLGSAYKNFFQKRSGYPRYKSKHREQTAHYTDGCFQISDGQLSLSKMPGLLRLKGTRAIPTYPTSCKVTKTVTGKYFVTLTVQAPVSRKAGTGTVGIDLGIKDLVTLSDGTKIPNPRHYVTLQRKLARAQRKLSKTKKGSNHRNKQRLKVARLHERIANTRKDFHHKLSSQIVLDNQAIVMECLNVKGMLRNHCLAKHISDAGWSMFRGTVAYKVAETDTGVLLVADTFYPSSQLCSTCGTKSVVKLGLATREWVCPVCGSHHDRDVNAAMNLKLLGERMLDIIDQGFVPQGKKIYLSKEFGDHVHLNQLHVPWDTRDRSSVSQG